MKGRVRTVLAITTMLAANTLAQSSASEDQIFSIHELCRSPQATPEDLQAYLDLQVDINAPDDVFQRTPLMWACRSNLDASFIKHLIQCGADVRAQDNQGRSALHHTAAKNINAEILASLINAGANLHQTDNRGHTALHLACQNNPSIETVSMLLRASSPIDQKNKDGCTALHLAAGSNPNAEIVSVLIRAGANIQEQDSAGWSPLHHACSPYANHDAFQTLLTAGADANARDNRGRLPLHHAIEQDESITKSCLLILHGSDINAREFPTGNSPLKLAAKKRNLSLLALLVDSGADVNAKSFNGTGPESTFHTDPEDPCLLFLKSCGLDLSDHVPFATNAYWRDGINNIEKWARLGVDFSKFYDSIGMAALLQNFCIDAGWKSRDLENDRATLRELFRHGLDVNRYIPYISMDGGIQIGQAGMFRVKASHALGLGSPVGHKFTLLHFFVSLCHEGDVELLLKSGARLNAHDTHGNTALHFSAAMHTDLLELLLERGASINKTNRFGNTPLGTHLLRTSEFSVGFPPETFEVVSSLVKYGADVNNLICRPLKMYENFRKPTITFPLHLAIQTESDFKTELVSLLLDAGAEVNQSDSNLNFPLHHAARTGSDALVMLLLSAGANVNQEDANGKTALYWAELNPRLKKTRSLERLRNRTPRRN